MSKNKRLAVNIILICNAIIISYLESFIPIPIPVPGIKLGLANIIILIAIEFLDLKDALFIMTVKCLIIALLTKGVVVLAFSLSGGILSVLGMWFVYHHFSRFFSIKGVSIVGALLHNVGQIGAAFVILKSSVIFYYLPVLLLSALITGFITGTIGSAVIREIRIKGILHDQNENR
ncbi:MAG TPA: Gx transporter family protein [Clostridiales bacterium]|nr:Gx transporter family protein [Clostridiales bacterium]